MHSTTVFHRVCAVMGVQPHQPLAAPAGSAEPRGPLRDQPWVREFLEAEAAAMRDAGLTVYLVTPHDGTPWFDLTWFPEDSGSRADPLSCKFWLADAPAEDGYHADFMVPTATERSHPFHFAASAMSLNQLREWFKDFVGLSLLGCRSHRSGRLSFATRAAGAPNRSLGATA